MTKLFAWLGAAMLMVMFAHSTARAQASEPLKPYVVFAFDTSGSMATATGSGPPSCGGTDTRLNHARCALNKIVNSYGDMTFALGHFRATKSGTVSGTFPSGCCWRGADEGASGSCAAGPTCNATSDMFELVTALVEGQNVLAERWTNFSGNTCINTGTDPEIWQAAGNTPLEGTLRGAKQYFVGGQGATQTIWPAAAGAAGGYDPIRNDPTKTSFLPTGCDPSPTCTVNCCATQCRPYIVILMTDGAETCSGTPANGASSLLQTDVDGRRYRVETVPIGFGIAEGDGQIESIAHAGGKPDVSGIDEGYYASDEAGLQLAISQILDDAIRTETCNNLDDDCDITVDEGFNKTGTCSNGKLGKCRVNGTPVCRADGTNTECNAGFAACVGRTAGQSCSVVNASSATVPGTCQTVGPSLSCVPTAAPSEVPTGCNNIDDDCDGLIDEGVTGCTCVPTTEICDGINNDCDGATDEGTDVPCGTGTCTGVRPCAPSAGCDPSPTCTTGNCCLGACTAPPSNPEICDGLDNNCDGNADGFQEACSNMFCPGGTCTGGIAPDERTCVGGSRAGKRCDTFTPTFNPQNNPKAKPGSGCAALGAACVCNPGSRNCPLNGGGVYSACTGEVEPGIEICNNLDDDCDGRIDETPPVTCTNDANCPSITPDCDNPSGMPNMGTCQPADCSINSCGGQLLCVNGVQTCTQQAGVDDTCNGVDEDCDMMVDEAWECTDPDGADNIPGNADDCPCTAGGQCNAHESCQNGSVVCMGDPVAQESCNCADDDCDGMTDEGSLCGAGATCTNCQCAFACSPGEFPCPMGKICLNNFCVADPCFGVTCPQNPNDPTDKQVCKPNPNNPAAFVCLSACDPTVITCPSPLICYKPTGECRPDDCTTFPERCADNESCINGTCVGNPCNGVTCPAGEYCNAGQCYGSCAAVDCPDGQRCRLGQCEEDPCEQACPFGQACDDASGQCVNDQCGFVVCPQGQWCNPNNGGQCEDDPCAIFDITCAEGEVCKGGTCFDKNDFLPDAGIEQHVTTGGGGGCSTSGGESSLLLGLGLVWLLGRRRRERREGGAL